MCNILTLHLTTYIMSMNSVSATGQNPTYADSKYSSPSLVTLEKTIIRLAILQEPMFYTTGYDKRARKFMKGDEKTSFSTMKPSSLTYTIALRVNQLIEKYNVWICRDKLYWELGCWESSRIKDDSNQYLELITNWDSEAIFDIGDMSDAVDYYKHARDFLIRRAQWSQSRNDHYAEENRPKYEAIIRKILDIHNSGLTEYERLKQPQKIVFKRKTKTKKK